MRTKKPAQSGRIQGRSFRRSRTSLWSCWGGLEEGRLGYMK